MSSGSSRPGPPLWLLAELTYRCPLHCVFCYNPVDYATQPDELSTEDWMRVLREGRELGAVQCGLSGGEPLLRDDLEEIVAEAHRLGYYTNLLTSGVGLTAERAGALKAAGLDHVQLSFQDSTREMNDFLSHTKTFELKNRVAKIIKDQGWPMVMNVVIHRLNIDHIDRIIGMAAELGAEYIELANTQYYSWAFVNRAQLLPTHEQLKRAEAVTDAWRQKLGDRMRIFFVAPDYHEGKAKKCVNGWGSMFLTVAPDGTALPCHTAKMLPGLAFPNVRDMPLREVWFESEGFNRYRGTGWMKEPCVSCEHKEEDLGGCRCQAFLIAQDAEAADPVCRKSPHHGQVLAAVAQAEAEARTRVTEHPLVFRDPKESRRLAEAASAAQRDCT
ncbi:MAG TPA: pyrroloquinoline quinone biosynthesis protein PqqE [Piscinibacter sp.]|jgi:pyrroloquinoline quinone biosynthesis protein E|uniref:pyrroloquinoline quinone biosynthesis protein PqqE n=1 Tax=Piscinibacter sp. TaxID=1903157 RepID=UPI001B413247|nr:pyrroloquinoline quinone biosynthesis protein PqqE [Piscinibacter sp.]MBK7533143.1 pyrroloquinoline quinone biosynthesis protein PqqE [Piscinibacter sp.]MBP6542079.1 pyrroloquinoline quinone biosynthesis protein PqqE [Piscinibacter sp.]HOY33504.1 pyrroloquinoline quinone biosynthesis protein PqqE [Piscinibacter sp.]HPM65779.1 pyrroloquinoline quinone biosynthesis protein PqqE [Piscinibacter sp.]